MPYSSPSLHNETLSGVKRTKSQCRLQPSECRPLYKTHNQKRRSVGFIASRLTILFEARVSSPRSSACSSNWWWNKVQGTAVDTQTLYDEGSCMEEVPYMH